MEFGINRLLFTEEIHHADTTGDYLHPVHRLHNQLLFTFIHQIDTLFTHCIHPYILVPVYSNFIMFEQDFGSGFPGFGLNPSFSNSL
jgi:hypothetical protein